MLNIRQLLFFVIIVTSKTVDGSEVMNNESEVLVDIKSIEKDSANKSRNANPIGLSSVSSDERLGKDGEFYTYNIVPPYMLDEKLFEEVVYYKVQLHQEMVADRKVKVRKRKRSHKKPG